MVPFLMTLSDLAKYSMTRWKHAQLGFLYLLHSSCDMLTWSFIQIYGYGYDFKKKPSETDLTVTFSGQMPQQQNHPKSQIPVALPASTLANTPAEGNRRFHLRTESVWIPVTKPGRTPPITPTWAFKP